MAKAKRRGRGYSKSAASDVKREMHALKKGKLKMGGSSRRVKSRKQAIAIGLSEARRKGKKVPPARGRRRTRAGRRPAAPSRRRRAR